MDNRQNEAFRLTHTPHLKLVKNRTSAYDTIEITIGEEDTRQTYFVHACIQTGLLSYGAKASLHPMEDEHKIEKIEIFVDDSLAASVLFAQHADVPFAAYKIRKKTYQNIKVISYCSLHGSWEATLSLS